MNYAGLSATASRLIEKNGKAVTLRRVARTGSNPVTGDAGVEAVSDYPGKAVEVGYSIKERDGTHVRTDDRRFLLSGSGIPGPTVADRIVVGGVPLTIVAVNPEVPGDLPLFYEVQCRG